ncbi:DUF5996 family protein [Streptomyces palmae]|uniref:Uncharacterized protein n=1 Tax=Streptomyces palmae TaxID=1701085 RepID=A0A4Z0GYT4_9ACTN|nr:DUF5996 family protein [Streptomyces palmae]TGB03004.1 hypothetical protein E4099_20230 [Streptomyces palmae]
MSERLDAWPELDHAELAPMVDYVNRISQVAGKYTLDYPFEAGWGNVVLEVTPRGLGTPVFRHPDVTFTVHYRLLDGDVVIETDKDERRLPLTGGSVAAFYQAFCDAAVELGMPRPRTSLICEIPDSPATFEDDRAERTWDPHAARLMWQAMNMASSGLEAWQAPFLGHRPRVGVMWGGFDLSATRHRAQPTTPPKDAPTFMQNAQLNAYVSVGFSFKNVPDRPSIGMYAYIWPQPDGLEGRSWGVDGATWEADAGLVLLPWDVLRRTEDPHQAIVMFGDAVYQAAIDTADWPSDLVGPRVDGWRASRTPASTLQHMHG